MSFDEFLSELENEGFRINGRSYAFRDIGDWVLAFLRRGGRSELPGKVSFVLCARPKDFPGVEGTPLADSTEPHDYPFKLTCDDIRKGVRYESKLLGYEHDTLPIDSDWSAVYSILSEDLPKQLESLGVSGLKEQILSLKDLGYVEKIWITEGADA